MRIDSDLLRLKDILRTIEDIETFLEEGFEKRTVVFAVAYSVAIIGEAASKISKELQANHSHIPWQQIIGMRHRIIHDYGNVNIARLEEVTKSHLPQLKQHIQQILEN